MCDASSVALQKLQAVLDAPAQYKARVEEILALRHLHKQHTKMTESSTSISLSPEDLKRVYQVLVLLTRLLIITSF